MNLSISKRKNGRTYLSIQKRYWNKETKRNTSKSVESLGYLDELEIEFDDPITHFREVAKKMTEDENRQRRVSIAIDMNEKLQQDSPGTKNLGYALPMK